MELVWAFAGGLGESSLYRRASDSNNDISCEQDPSWVAYSLNILGDGSSGLICLFLDCLDYCFCCS